MRKLVLSAEQWERIRHHYPEARNGLPLSVSVHSANPHEARLVQLSAICMFLNSLCS